MCTDADEDSPEEVALAQRLLKAVRSLRTQELRGAYLRDGLNGMPGDQAVRVLDILCRRARGPREDARALLVALTGMLKDPRSRHLLANLRAGLVDHQAEALRPLVPSITSSATPSRSARGNEPSIEARVPDYGTGRTLTLGERKALARKPTRKLLDRLMLDPHADVIRNLLVNPLVTEDDIVRLAARRPIRADVAAEIARHPRWNVRQRVRMALLLNPYCPPEVGVPLVALLLRPELRTAIDGPETSAEVRTAALKRMREMAKSARKH